jgi:hypothetical protein
MYATPYDSLAPFLTVQPARLRTGQHYAPSRPALARLAHIRAVLAIRLSPHDSDAYPDGRAWWRSERRINHEGALASVADRSCIAISSTESRCPVATLITRS